MMTKVFDLLRSLGWYIIHFIYDLIDGLLEIIKKLNAFDIINSLSNNQTFKNFYTGVMAIAVTLFALFIIWKFVNKLLDSDEETTFKNIIMEIVKCGTLIMMSTFLFVQVSNFSITLSNYTGNIFESSTNTKMDEKDYKYDINWIMAILCGGFFLYSLFFAGIMLGRRQIEFLFLFSIAPIVFATSVGNKQRRGAVIEQLVSLALQSAVVMLIVSLTVMVMQEIGATTFFTNNFMNLTTKSLLYLGCATFILTGSQVINRFIGANVSAASGREQLMSLMGYGKMAGIGATLGAGATIGGGLLATGAAMKGGKAVGSQALSQAGIALGTMGMTDGGQPQSRMQKFATTMGSKMYATGQRMGRKPDSNKFSASDAFINAGASSLGNTVRKVMPRASYNTSYYRRRKNMI